MDKYLIIERKVFEKLDSFEKRINEQARKGYKAINLSSNDRGGYAVLFEKLS